MKKSFIFAGVFVGILIISFVSAGLWSDLFNRPPRVTGDVINIRGMDLDLNKLSEGIQLSKGWNYWFIWKDSEMPVSQILSNLDANSYRYAYQSNPQTRKTAFWYGNTNSLNKFDKFVNGNWYAIYMLSSAEWKYSGDPIRSDGEYYTKAEIDAKLGALKGTCQYIHYQDSSYTGYNLSNMPVINVCREILGGFVPKIIVQTELTSLYNKRDCSPSQYRIYDKASDNLISYKTELADLRLGQSTSNACNNAVFPDGSNNDGFSTRTYRLYSGVLCCNN